MTAGELQFFAFTRNQTKPNMLMTPLPKNALKVPNPLFNTLSHSFRTGDILRCPMAFVIGSIDPL